MSVRKTLITGAHGFLGSHTKARFLSAGYREEDIYCPKRSDYDLTRLDRVQAMYADFQPEHVVHIAADIGGIGYSRANPGKQLYNNLLMNTYVLDEAYKAGVNKFVGIGTVCSYPKLTPVPFRELDLWNGYPEETNAAYGLSKKMMLEQSRAYRQQYDFNAIHLLMINLYGPGDDFHPENSHVIPALIRKVDAAVRNGESEIVMWGDGTPTREFLYVSDAADAIIRATSAYDHPDPVNIGSGTETSISDLVRVVSELMGYAGDVVWDSTKPNGQPRRRLDVSRAKNEFGFEATVDLQRGLRKTIDWYHSGLK